MPSFFQLFLSAVEEKCVYEVTESSLKHTFFVHFCEFITSLHSLKTFPRNRPFYMINSYTTIACKLEIYIYYMHLLLQAVFQKPLP